MALWYDSKKREYASDGKNGWFKKYCDTLVSDLNGLFEVHFKGLSNRHNARDVDYDEEMTVRDKLDDIDSDISETAKDLQNKINTEASERKTEDAKLGGRIDAEAEARQKGDADMMNALRDESEDLNNRIDEEISDRKDADTALGQRIDAEIEELEEKLRGTMPNPISIYETELNHTWRPGFYRSHIVELKPDFGDVNTDWTVAVSNSSYTDDIGDTYFKITQAAIGDDGTVKAYRTVCAKCDNESQVLNTETFGEWKFVTLYIADIAGLQEELTDITTKVDRKGTWVNPYIVSDPETDLLTLTTPGVYHFDFEEKVYAVNKEGYGDFGCYANGYMEVVSLWNDYSSKAAAGQTLYVCDEGQFYSCTRVVDSGIGGKWRISAWVTDITNPDLESRVAHLENKKGSWSNPYIVSDPETDLSTLTTPGVYHFTFEKEVYAEKKEGYGNFGCYTNGYMEVVSLWNDCSSKSAVGQTLYVCDEGQFYSCTRVVESGVGVKWKISAWVTDITNPNLESRVAHLEKVIKSLTGGSENEAITTATEDEADNVLNKYFS